MVTVECDIYEGMESSLIYLYLTILMFTNSCVEVNIGRVGVK